MHGSGLARILILDDARSIVDTVAEERILDGLAEELPGRPGLLGVASRVSRAARGRIFVWNRAAPRGEGAPAAGLSTGHMVSRSAANVHAAGTARAAAIRHHSIAPPGAGRPLRTQVPAT